MGAALRERPCRWTEQLVVFHCWHQRRGAWPFRLFHACRQQCAGGQRRRPTLKASCVIRSWSLFVSRLVVPLARRSDRKFAASANGTRRAQREQTPRTSQRTNSGATETRRQYSAPSRQPESPHRLSNARSFLFSIVMTEMSLLSQGAPLERILPC